MFSNITVSPAFVQRFGQILAREKELSRGLFTELPFSVVMAEETVVQKRLNLLDLQILKHEQELLAQEMTVFDQLFKNVDKVNVLDILMYSSSYALPLVLDIFAKNQVGWYGAIAPVPGVAEKALQKMQIFTLEYNLAPFPLVEIKTDLEISHAAQTIHNLQQNFSKGQKSVNLFLLLDSLLGKYVNPELFLQNIHSSMQSGDYLVISQGIYQPGLEDDLVADYQKLKPKLGNSRSLANLINPEFELTSEWIEKKIPGVHLYVRPEREMQIFGQKIQAGEKISVMRHTRFPENYLKNLFEKTGLKILEIIYHKDCALFLLQKT